MPVRSINLKLLIPRSEADTSLRQALWTTHAEVNAATKYYECQLLRIRADAFEAATDEGDEIRKMSRAEAETTALAMARSAQRTNFQRLNGNTTMAEPVRAIVTAVPISSLACANRSRQASNRNRRRLGIPGESTPRRVGISCRFDPRCVGWPVGTAEPSPALALA
jgi:hypothetical protein